MEPLKVRRIRVTGTLRQGVYAKDVILTIIQRLGVRGGAGYAYEYAGDAIERMSMDERMTICNMSIEGGARVGYVNPDETTFEYLEGPAVRAGGRGVRRARRRGGDRWPPIATRVYDDDVEIRAEELTPVVTWGVNPGQSVGVDGRVPIADEPGQRSAGGDRRARRTWGFAPGQPIAGMKVDVAFIGSCTNCAAVRPARGRAHRPRATTWRRTSRRSSCRARSSVSRAAEQEGLAEIFRAAGFEWRGAGCSMCLGMNPDKLEGNQVCASSSNRNFKGRQGSPTGRTLLMSPAMVAAAAVAGEVTDVRRLVN